MPAPPVGQGQPDSQRRSDAAQRTAPEDGNRAASEAAEPLSFAAFIEQVRRNNLELLAGQHAVLAAEAQIAVAKVFPDPVLSGGLSQLDISGQSAPLMSSLGLTVPLELGGKRASRVSLARGEVGVARAELAETWQRLRAAAATAYVDALAAQLVVERKRHTLASLERLVAVNEKRVQSGDVGEVALLQSRVECQRYRAEVLQADAEAQAARLALRAFLGHVTDGGQAPLELSPLPPLSGRLQAAPRQFEIAQLFSAAQRERPDVQVRHRAAEAARARIDLAQRSRWIDVSLNLSWQRSLYSEPFASPQYDALSAILSFPLPLSRLYRGELAAAEQGEKQASAQAAATALRAAVEVSQALVRYRAAVERLSLYTQGMLNDAEHVHTATLYSYQRGGASLLEVLAAQRTVDEVSLAYADALAEHARQLIALERAAGIWDLDF